VPDKAPAEVVTPVAYPEQATMLLRTIQ